MMAVEKRCAATMNQLATPQYLSGEPGTGAEAVLSHGRSTQDSERDAR